MNEGFTKIEHSLWECDLTMEERYMLMFLLDCENRFNKKDDWFSLTDDDFINVGFGKNKVVLRRTRNALLEKGWIGFQRGAVGKKSQYMINRDEEKVSFLNYEEFLKAKAEELSNNMTKSEKRVAKWLDGKGIRYTPQCPIMCYPQIGYIADFVLPDYNAIIEVDGETHNSEEAKEKDALRTKHLNNKGYRVYRIDNKHTKDEYINSTMADIVFDMGWEKEADRLSVKVVNGCFMKKLKIA